MDWRIYFKDVRLMQLATSRDNQPWLCNVWYVHDTETDNIYFTSRKTRRHSEDIAINERVACTFHKHYEDGLGQRGQSLVIAGKARLLTDELAIGKAFDLYEASHPKLSAMQARDVYCDGSGVHFFYEISPIEIVVFDDVNYPNNPRQEFKNG